MDILDWTPRNIEGILDNILHINVVYVPQGVPKVTGLRMGNKDYLH